MNVTSAGLVGVSHKRHKKDTTAVCVHKNSSGVLQNLDSAQALFKVFLDSRRSAASIHPGNGIRNHRFR